MSKEGKSGVLKYAFLNALGTAVYVALVGIFMYIMNHSDFPDESSILIPIGMLMLLVFSVALVGSLIFGRPVFWYIDGKKKEALRLLAYTLIIFLAITVVVLFLLLVFLSRPVLV